MTEDDRLKRLEDAVESLQKHVKWLLEQHARTDGWTVSWSTEKHPFDQ